MKKRLIISILMVLFLSTVALSQTSNWKFSKVFLNGSVHGIVITPDNCMWINLFGGCYDDLGVEIPAASDLVLNLADGSVKAVLSNVAPDGGGRGMSLGHDGKVYSSHGPAFYVIDYATMQIIRRIVPIVGLTGNNLTTPVADEFGNVLISFVYPSGSGGIGVLVYSDEGELSGTAIAASTTNLTTMTRDLALTPDGNDLFVATLSSGAGVGHWHSDDGAWGGGSYSFVDFIGGRTEGGAANMYAGTGQVAKIDQQGKLWIGADGTMELSRYDCWDLEKMELVDRIVSFPNPDDIDGLLPGNAVVPEALWVQGAFVTPRGFAMSNDGKKAYIVDFNTGILEFEYVGEGQSDAKEPQAVPEGFALSQNYPNPFNPSTNFTYSLPNKADVRIAIYDLFGREINTLVNESKDAGTYTTRWNGRDNQNRQVATGVYFYKMQAAGFEKTMKMMLVK